MEKSKTVSWKMIAFYTFIFIQFTAWMTLIFAQGSWLHYLSYGSVVLCFIYAMVCSYTEKDSVFQLGACFFTAIADFFLILLKGEQKTLAMCAFLIAQGFYACRTFLLAEEVREKKLQITLRAVFSVIGGAAVGIVLQEKAEALFVISVVYYVNLILSMVFAFMHFHKSLSAKLLAIGLLCFALCDISIGFDFLIDIFSLSEGNFIYFIAHLPVSFVTIFYPPSQALLCLSVKTYAFFKRSYYEE